MRDNLMDGARGREARQRGRARNNVPHWRRTPLGGTGTCTSRGAGQTVQQVVRSREVDVSYTTTSASCTFLGEVTPPADMET